MEMPNGQCFYPIKNSKILGFANEINLYFRKSYKFSHLNYQICYLTTEVNNQLGRNEPNNFCH
jgi:hypothetical protein